MMSSFWPGVLCDHGRKQQFPLDCARDRHFVLVKQRSDLPFRFDVAWVCDDNVASQQVTADVRAAPEVPRVGAVTDRSDVSSFADDVLFNLVSLKDMFGWRCIPYPLSATGAGECGWCQDLIAS